MAVTAPASGPNDRTRVSGPRGDLPDDVLKKVYFGNALRLTKGLPQDGWPK